MYALTMRPNAQVGDQEYPAVFSRDMSGTAWRVWSRLFVVINVSQIAPHKIEDEAHRWMPLRQQMKWKFRYDN